MSVVHRLATLVVKELLSYFRDPRTRMILIGPPLLQLLVFSFATTLEVRNVDIVVLNQDTGSLSDRFVERLVTSSFVGDLSVVHDAASFASLLDTKQALLAIHLPSNFSSRALAGRSAIAQVLLDGRRANAAQVAYGYIANIAAVTGVDVAADGGLNHGRGGGLSSGLVGDPASSALLRGTASSIETRHWFNPNLSYRWFIVPSLSGVLALMISVMVTALSIARERELGTFDQLLVSPISSVEIIIGKSLPAVLLGSALAGIMILAGVLLFQIPFTGSALLLTIAVVLFILSGVGIGLSISAVCATQQQAILGAFAVVVPVILTSGYATPVENMPAWLQALSLANPLRHFLVIVQGSFMKAMPPAEVIANTWPLVLIGAMMLGVASVVVTRRLE